MKTNELKGPFPQYWPNLIQPPPPPPPPPQTVFHCAFTLHYSSNYRLYCMTWPKWDMNYADFHCALTGCIAWRDRNGTWTGEDFFFLIIKNIIYMEYWLNQHSTVQLSRLTGIRIPLAIKKYSSVLSDTVYYKQKRKKRPYNNQIFLSDTKKYIHIKSKNRRL